VHLSFVRKVSEWIAILLFRTFLLLLFVAILLFRIRM
jgi:hypothetical protein